MKMINIATKSLMAAFGLALAGSVYAAEESTEAKPYPLSKCILTGKKLGDKPVTITQEGREFKFCCNNCAAKFKETPEAIIGKIDAAAKEAAKKNPYPLQACVVSDEKLDAMGKPFIFVYADREVKLCCEGCLKAFKKEPAKYMKKMASAAKAEK